MANHIQGVTPTPGLVRDGKARTTAANQQKHSDQSESSDAVQETAHDVELSPESISKAQRIVTGGGYITSGDPGDIDFTDEEALALATELGSRLQETAKGLIQPPSAELAGMVG